MTTLNPRILIAVPCHNRRRVAELCLPTMRDSIVQQDMLVLHNDGSSEYGYEWLKQFTPAGFSHVRDHYPAIGIQAQRRLHLHDFLHNYTGHTHLYFSDHDAIMDPTWRNTALGLQARHGHRPLCLYNTRAHSDLAGNTISEDASGEVIWRRFAPGVSYLLTREHVEQLAPFIPTLQHFDWQIPAILGPFATSRTSYVDHIGWGGERHPAGEGPEGGDRATNPTPWLVAKRAEIVEALKA